MSMALPVHRTAAARSPYFEQVGDLDAFRGRPAWRCLIGHGLVVWQAGTLAVGTIAWGQPAAADVDFIADICDLSSLTHLAGHASIVDVRAIEAVDLVLA